MNQAVLTAAASATDKIVLAAQAIGSADFTHERLVVRCWELFPEFFGLRTFSEHYPCSNRVVAALCHRTGPIARGLLCRTGAKRYQLTSAGRKLAAQLLVGSEA